MVEDKLSMAHSLEARVPFLDNDLVDFAVNLPVRLKLRQRSAPLNGSAPSCSDGKLLLRKAMERHLPASIVRRKKQGFSGPDASWFRNEGIDHVRSVLDPKHAKIWSYLDSQATRPLIDEHLEGRQNRRLLIWSLLYFEEFLRAGWEPDHSKAFLTAEKSASRSVPSEADAEPG
jgi:asparagine synthase (glutamine-hydrolysing)